MGTPKRSTSHYGSASGFRITAQFIQGETDVHLWSGTFDPDRSSAVLGVLVHAYAGAGRRAEALRMLDDFTGGDKPVTSCRSRFLTPTGDSVTRSRYLHGSSVPPKNDRTLRSF